MTTRIDLLYSPNCMVGTIFGIIDLLRVTNRLWRLHNPRKRSQPFWWRVINGAGEEMAMPDWLVNDEPTQAIPDIVAAKNTALIIPGLDMQNVPHLSRMIDQARAELELIANRHASGGVIAACYNGSTMLARAGVVNDKNVTVTWLIAGWFRHTFPNVRLRMDAPVSVDGNIVTAGASAAYMELTIELVRRFAGDELAQILTNGLLYHPDRYEQAGLHVASQTVKTPDSVVFRAKQWIEQHVNDPYCLSDVAEAASVSKTTLLRHFRDIAGITPLAYLQKLRIERAKQLLEVTSLNLTSVAETCGYQDPSAFRRLFRRETGMTLSEYRQKYAVRESRLRWRGNE